MRNRFGKYILYSTQVFDYFTSNQIYINTAK